MNVAVRLPQFSMADNEATVVTWLKAEGQTVAAGEPIVEVETAKATATLDAPESGVLSRILVREGSSCAAGETIALIERTGA